MSVPGITETRQYLAFNLDEESFALDVARVREILEFTAVTKVPGTPDFMKGVINLRGSVVPVMDMRVKFNLPAKEKTVDTCIIVVEATLSDEEQVVLGALVDSVQEVFELEPDQIQPVSKISTGLSSRFITGMGKRDENFVIILDLDRVFSFEELDFARREVEEDSRNIGTAA